jgi:hypothetical protein
MPDAARHRGILKNNGRWKPRSTSPTTRAPRTTKLYDRRQHEISHDEVERIAI